MIEYVCTLRDLVNYLLFEAMILAILGHFNFYIPKEQRKKAKKHCVDDETNDVYTIKIHFVVPKEWYLALSAIALIILWGKYLETNFNLVINEITSNDIFSAIIIISLIILIFVISVIVLFIAPFFGATKAIEYYKQYYSHAFGVMVDI